jgi:hypothetical protein
MSYSLRNRRIRVYAYTDATANGLVSNTYAFLGEYWGRLEPPTGAELNVAEQANYQIDASVLLDGDLTIPPQGLIRDCRTGTLYKIEAVLPRRQTREQQVHGSATTDAQPAYAITGDPPSD